MSIERLFSIGKSPRSTDSRRVGAIAVNPGSCSQHIAEEGSEETSDVRYGARKLKTLFTSAYEEVFIQLEEPHKVFGPGDAVRGKVNLSLSKPSRALYTSLSFAGFVDVGASKQRVRTQLFQEQLILWGTKLSKVETSSVVRQMAQSSGNESSQAQEEFTNPGHIDTDGRTHGDPVECSTGSSPWKVGVMDAGRHVFSFEFFFPETSLPSSLDFGRGSIVYTLTCEYQKPKNLVARNRVICQKDLAFLEAIDICSIPPPRIRHIDPDSKSKRKEGGGKVQAYVELTKGACLKGDTLYLNVQIHHVKPIKSMKGTVATLYRLSRIDASNFAPQTFRKDLSQTISPLLVDPQTLDYRLSTRLKVPADAFPTIKATGLVSFRYFVEVVIDLAGKTTVYEGKTGSTLSVNNTQFNIETGGNAMETESMKREKDVHCVVFEVVLGTRSSYSNLSPAARQHMTTTRTGSYDSHNDIEYAGAHTYVRAHTYARNDYIHGEDGRDTSSNGSHSFRSHERSQPSPYVESYPLSKADLGRREAALLPSAPPDDEVEDGLSDDHLYAPSAPIIALSDDDIIHSIHEDIPEALPRLNSVSSSPLIPPGAARPIDSSSVGEHRQPSMIEEEFLRQRVSAPLGDVVPDGHFPAASAPNVEDSHIGLPTYRNTSLPAV